MQHALVEELLALRRDAHVHVHAHVHVMCACACACDVCMHMRMCMFACACACACCTCVSHECHIWASLVPKHADLACRRHHLQLPEEALREHATCCLVSPEHSSPALPRLLLLSALELWPASQQLLASASRGLLCADLWLPLPWRAWLKMLKAFLAAPWLGRGYSSRMHPPIAGLLHALKKRAAAAQNAISGCHAAQRSLKLEISQSQHPGGSLTSLGGDAHFK